MSLSLFEGQIWVRRGVTIIITNNNNKKYNYSRVLGLAGGVLYLQARSLNRSGLSDVSLLRSMLTSSSPIFAGLNKLSNS